MACGPGAAGGVPRHAMAGRVVAQRVGGGRGGQLLTSAARGACAYRRAVSRHSSSHWCVRHPPVYGPPTCIRGGARGRDIIYIYIIIIIYAGEGGSRVKELGASSYLLVSRRVPHPAPHPHPAPPPDAFCAKRPAVAFCAGAGWARAPQGTPQLRQL